MDRRLYILLLIIQQFYNLMHEREASIMTRSTFRAGTEFGVAHCVVDRLHKKHASLKQVKTMSYAEKHKL